jgi:hypothetical protein
VLGKRFIHLVDVAPTMPIPLDVAILRQLEGKILWDIME